MVQSPITSSTSLVCTFFKQSACFGQHSSKELDLEMNAIEFMVWMFPKANSAVLTALTFVPLHLLIVNEPTAVCVVPL
jgi:hypothetical protein